MNTRRLTGVLTLALGIAVSGAGCSPAPEAAVEGDDPGGASPVATPARGDDQAPATEPADPPESRADLIARLQARDIAVEDVSHSIQPFLTPEGRVLELVGGPLGAPASLQTFEYESADTAAAEAAKIGPDGSPSGTHISWMAPPAYYRSGRLIALYVGHDDQARALLAELFGPPFAGDDGH